MDLIGESRTYGLLNPIVVTIVSAVLILIGAFATLKIMRLHKEKEEQEELHLAPDNGCIFRCLNIYSIGKIEPRFGTLPAEMSPLPL